MLKKMKQLIEEMKALEAKSITVEGADLEAVKTEIAAKNREFDSLERQVELEAKASKLLDVEAKATVSVHAEAKDHKQEAKAKDDIALRWMAGKSLSGQEYSAVGGDKDGIIIANGALADYLLGKTVLTTDVPGSVSGGGSLVPDTLIRQLSRTANRQPMLVEYCKVFNGVTGAIDVPVQITKAAAATSAEGAAYGGTEPTYDQVTITTKRYSGMTKVSERSLENSIIDVQANVFEDLRNSIMNLISSEIVTKILANSDVAEVNRDTTSEVVYTDLVNLIYGIAQPERRMGIFCVSDAAEKYLVGQVDAEGRPLYANSTGSSNFPTLAGYTYVADGSNAVALGGIGDAIFGNFDGVGVAMESGIKLARGYDSTDFSKGLVTIRAHVYGGVEVLIGSKFAKLIAAS